MYIIAFVSRELQPHILKKESSFPISTVSSFYFSVHGKHGQTNLPLPSMVVSFKAGTASPNSSLSSLSSLGLVLPSGTHRKSEKLDLQSLQSLHNPTQRKLSYLND